MFFKKVAKQELNAPNTVLGEGMYLEAAKMTGKESVRIDGMYSGKIDIDGSLVLGDTGNITGDVNAHYYLVAGEMVGDIQCHSQLHFASTASVTGNVNAASIIVDEGCHVSGTYRIGEPRPRDRDGNLLPPPDDSTKVIEQA